MAVLGTVILVFIATHMVNFWAKMHFDKKFDLKSDDQMYCAEILYKELRAATKERIILPITERENYSTKKLIGVDTATIKHFKYVAIDN